MNITTPAKRFAHGAIIFTAIILTPFLPDSVLPPNLYKAILTGCGAALLIGVFNKVFKNSSEGSQ